MGISITVSGSVAKFVENNEGKYQGFKEALDAIYRAIADGADILAVSLTDFQYPLKDLDGYLLKQEDVYAKYIKNSLQERARDIVITTGLTISSASNSIELGIVSSHVVYGVNFLKDTLVDLTGTFGGRSSSLETYFHNARIKATEELQIEAAKIGAKGVVAVSFEFSQLSNNMAHCSAIGTAIAY